MDVSIVIVNYKTPQLLLDCIKSVYKHTNDCLYEIIIVDNDSKDESKELVSRAYPNVIWIDMKENSGFGVANNVGIRKSKGEFTLLLNSDTELFEDAISQTLNHVKRLEKNKYLPGLVGCQIKHKDGRLQPSCNYYWSGIREAIEEHPFGIKVLQHWFKIKKLRDKDKYEKLNNNHRITWLGVPFALIRTTIIQDFLFDENFFMYSEDEELNYRLSKAGYSPYLFCETGIYHHIGASSGFNSNRDRQIFFSKLLFLFKVRGSFYFKIYCGILKSVYKWNKKLSNKDDSNKIEWINKALLLIPKLAQTDKKLNCYSDEF